MVASDLAANGRANPCTTAVVTRHKGRVKNKAKYSKISTKNDDRLVEIVYWQRWKDKKMLWENNVIELITNDQY